MDLSKRVAVITGGASGIGRAVAAGMARRNVTGVALVDVSEAVEDIAERLNAWLALPEETRAPAREALARRSAELWSWDRVADGVIAAKPCRSAIRHISMPSSNMMPRAWSSMGIFTSTG